MRKWFAALIVLAVVVVIAVKTLLDGGEVAKEQTGRTEEPSGPPAVEVTAATRSEAAPKAGASNHAAIDPPRAALVPIAPVPPPRTTSPDPVKEGPEARIDVGRPSAPRRSTETAEVKNEPPKADEGRLTFQGSYGYKAGSDPTPQQLSRVTVSGTLDCGEGKGSMYYRDPAQRIEWQSSQFGFSAADVCVSDRDSLQAMASRFNAIIEGRYSPLSVDGTAEVLGDGDFAMRFIGSDATGVTLAAAKFCFVLRGGAYHAYRLPRNATKPSTDPGCTFLDSFSVKRSK